MTNKEVHEDEGTKVTKIDLNSLVEENDVQRQIEGFFFLSFSLSK